MLRPWLPAGWSASDLISYRQKIGFGHAGPFVGRGRLDRTLPQPRAPGRAPPPLKARRPAFPAYHRFTFLPGLGARGRRLPARITWDPFEAADPSARRSPAVPLSGQTSPPSAPVHPPLPVPDSTSRYSSDPHFERELLTLVKSEPCLPAGNLLLDGFVLRCCTLLGVFLTLAGCSVRRRLCI